MVDVDLESYDNDTIAKAFWLQEKIRRDGTPAVKYMATARKLVVARGSNVVAKHVNASLKRL